MKNLELGTQSGKYALRFDCEDPDQVFVETNQQGAVTNRISISVRPEDQEEMLTMLKEYLMRDSEERDDLFREFLDFLSVGREFHVIDFRIGHMDGVKELYTAATKKGSTETWSILCGNPTMEDLGTLQAAIAGTRDDSTENMIAVVRTSPDDTRLGVWY